jgi:hypothetical protein
MRYPLVERRDPIFPSSVNWQAVARSSIVDALRGHVATPSSLGEADLAVDQPEQAFNICRSGRR